MRQHTTRMSVAAGTMLLAFSAGGAAAQTVPDVTVKVTGRIQYQFHTSSVNGVGSTFALRRLRLGAQIGVGDAIRGAIEPDYSQGELTLKAAWIEYIIDSAFTVRAGQVKKPFSRLQLTSSLVYPTIERGLRIRGLADAYAALDEAEAGPVLSRLDGPLLGEEQLLLDGLGYQAYDVGVTVHGAAGAFGYEVGVFNGTGADALDADGSKALAGRITFAPLERLALGAGISRTDLVFDSADGTGVAYEIDAEWGDFRDPGAHVLAELAYGDHVVAADEFIAAQAVLAWFAPLTLGRVEGVEPVLRGSWGDPRRNVADDAGVLVTPGVNVYLSGRNRLMMNFDVYLPQGERFTTEQSLKVQAQLHF